MGCGVCEYERIHLIALVGVVANGQEKDRDNTSEDDVAVSKEGKR